MKKSKINLIMMGGLGNQLFQYATASKLSKFFSAELVLDYRFLKFFGVKHPISLTDFSFKEPVIQKVDNLKFRFFKRAFVKAIGLIRRISYLSFFLKMKLGVFLSSRIDETILPSKINQPRLLFGYFQTKHYIESARDALELPVFPRVSSYRFTDYYENILNKEIVAIHVRLGDYKDEKETIGNLSEGYYLSALDFFESKFPNSRYYVFTNDVDSLAQNFPRLLSKECVELFRPQVALSDFETFSLMCACSGHIIANSTFSFWAAALATNSKTIIRPSKWFKNLTEPQDLFPDNWLKADSDWF
jgi:hypothetical protein